MFISSILINRRLPRTFLDSVSQEGAIQIPKDVLSPRMICVRSKIEFKVSLLKMRDFMIPVVSRREAERIVSEEGGHYEEQYLLVQTIDTYLKDKEVIKEVPEFQAATTAKSYGEKLAAVAIIGSGNSLVTIARNILNGDLPLSDKEKVKRQIRESKERQNYFLIVDS